MKLILAAIGAGAAVVVAIAVGVTAASYLAYIFFASLALFSNLIALAAYFPKRLHYAGSQISHFGFSLMLIGILGSSAFSDSQKAVIDRHASHTVFGLDITYKGMAGEITTPDNEIILGVSDDDGANFEARPKLYWAQRMEALMKKPHIIRYPFYDLYLAPEQIQDLGGENGVRIGRGGSEEIGPYTITFKDFDQQAHEAGGQMRFGAILDVTDSAGTTHTIIPVIEFNPDRTIDYVDVPIVPEKDSTPVRLERILADDASIMLSVAGLTPQSPPDRLILEASKKPTMNFLWAGAIIVVLGGVTALWQRWKLSNSAGTNQIAG
jgi:cytochrome c-type biogenesis protein CcmF